MALLTTFAHDTWVILNESAPYVLLGFFVAALVKTFVPDDFVVRHLGKESWGSVFKASILGVPLPLCSCGVIPAATGLRKQGASRGATTAFLISTPETGADSIAVTWALLDPVMTVMRPLSAFVTASVAGLLANAIPEKKSEAPAFETVFQMAEKPAPHPHDSHDNCSCSDSDAGCGCSSGCGCHSTAEEMKNTPLGKRFKAGMNFAFGEMLSDIGVWLLGGILVAGLIGALIPDRFFTELLGGEWTSLLVMLVFGVPLYVCATASTPIAASLALKGLSPGAALVFLLAGPATNAATIAVVSRVLGKKAVSIYLGSIAVCSLGLGWLTNKIYASLGLDITSWVRETHIDEVTPFSIVCVVVLLALVFRSLRKKHVH